MPRELHVQYLLGHSIPMLVSRYVATYDSQKAAKAHSTFSPAMQLLGGGGGSRLGPKGAGRSGFVRRSRQAAKVSQRRRPTGCRQSTRLF